MVFRRRKQRVKKRSFRRKRYSRFRKSATAKSNRGLYKLSQALDLSSNVGGIINYAFSLTSISGALLSIDGAAPFGNLEDVTNVGALFDSYRVNAIKFKYIPQLPNDTSTTTGYFPLYSIVDIDTPNTSPPASSISLQIQYNTLRVYNMYRPWSRYVKVGKYNQASNRMGWLDLANIPNYGCCQFYGPGFDISQNYGKLIITYYISTFARR